MAAQQSSVEAKINGLEEKLQTLENKLEASESERETCPPDRQYALDIKIGGMSQRIAAMQAEITRLRRQQDTGELYSSLPLCWVNLCVFDCQNRELLVFFFFYRSIRNVLFKL
jgi:hypothetical protein